VQKILIILIELYQQNDEGDEGDENDIFMMTLPKIIIMLNEIDDLQHDEIDEYVY